MRYNKVSSEVRMRWWCGWVLFSSACDSVSPINPFQPLDTDATDTDVEPVDTGTIRPPDTIESVHLGQHPLGSVVHLSGVIVTGGSELGAFVQTSGGGQNKGVYVDFSGFGPAGAPEIGAVVEVRGEVEDKHGLTQVSLTESGGWIPSGEVVSPTLLSVRPGQVVGNPEPYEGVLLTVQEPGVPLTVLDPNLGFGEFSVSSNLRIDDLYFRWSEGHSLLAGDTFESISGILTYSFGEHKLLPRAADDFVGHVAQTGVLEALQPGDLVVTEMMPDPSFCSDNYCEWIEIHNRSGDEIDLLGLQLEDASGNTGEVTTSVVVPDGERVVLGRGDGSQWGYGFVAAAFYGSDLSLNNSTDRVVLRNSTQILFQTPDYVEIAAGASFQLAVGTSAADAASWDRWCVSSTTIPSSDGDRGSPGAENSSCL